MQKLVCHLHRTRIFCGFLLVFIVQTSFAQTHLIDSITRLISLSKTDTERVRLVNDKVSALVTTNLDSGIMLGLSNQVFAASIHDLHGEARSANLLSHLYCFKGNYPEARAQLIHVKKIVDQTGDKKDNISLMGSYGMYFGMQALYDSSAIYLREAIRLAHIINDTMSLATNYQNLATSYTMLSDYTGALLNYDSALRFYQGNKEQSGEAYIHINKGILYLNLEDTRRAKAAFLRALYIARKNEMKNVECYASLNLATAFILENGWDSAYYYSLKASQIAAELGDKGAESSALSREGVALGHLKRYDEGIPLFKRAVLLADSSGENINIFQANTDFGWFLMSEGRNAEALTFMEKGFAARQASTQFDAPLAKTYQYLSECYEKNNRYKEALSAFKMAAKISDSVKNRDHVRQATEFTMNQEFERSRQVEKSAQFERDLVQQSKQRMLAGGLGFAFFLALLLFIAFTAKRKANRVLEEQKLELQTTMADLRSTQAQLIHAEKMASLGELTAGIAHEIQNPLNFVNNFSEVTIELLDELHDAIVRDENAEVHEQSRLIRANLEKILHHGQRANRIVKGMLQHSRTRRAEREPTNIPELTAEYARLAYNGFRSKDKSFQTELIIDVPPEMETVSVQPEELGRVLVNLINNAFYAVKDKKRLMLEKGIAFSPVVEIKVLPFPDRVEIRIRDNGVGIPEDIRQKIFQPFFTTKPPGDGTGLGLSLSYDIITSHSGTIQVNTIAEKGTEFIIALPTTKE